MKDRQMKKKIMKQALNKSNDILERLAKIKGYRMNGRFNSYNDIISFSKSTHIVAQAIAKEDNFQIKCSYDKDFKSFDSEFKSFSYIYKHCLVNGVNRVSKEKYQIIKDSKILGYIEAMDGQVTKKNYRWSIFDRNHILEDEYLNFSESIEILSNIKQKLNLKIHSLL